MKNKRRVSRISFYEWKFASFGRYNKGSIICNTCNFTRTININENNCYSDYQLDNKITRKSNCPKCKSNNWYWLYPTVKVPKLKSNNKVWKIFWNKLKSRKFNISRD